MKFSKEVGEKILAAFRERLPETALCPLCHANKWELLDAFVAIVISYEPLEVRTAGQVLPSAVLICNNCGNTHFLNLNVLGLSEILTPEEIIVTPESAQLKLETASPEDYGRD